MPLTHFKEFLSKQSFINWKCALRKQIWLKQNKQCDVVVVTHHREHGDNKDTCCCQRHRARLCGVGACEYDSICYGAVAIGSVTRELWVQLFRHSIHNNKPDHTPWWHFVVTLWYEVQELFLIQCSCVYVKCIFRWWTWYTCKYEHAHLHVENRQCGLYRRRCQTRRKIHCGSDRHSQLETKTVAMFNFMTQPFCSDWHDISGIPSRRGWYLDEPVSWDECSIVGSHAPSYQGMVRSTRVCAHWWHAVDPDPSDGAPRNPNGVS